MNVAFCWPVKVVGCEPPKPPCILPNPLVVVPPLPYVNVKGLVPPWVDYPNPYGFIGFSFNYFASEAASV